MRSPVVANYLAAAALFSVKNTPRLWQALLSLISLPQAFFLFSENGHPGIPTPYRAIAGSIHRLDTSSSAAICEWFPGGGCHHKIYPIRFVSRSLDWLAWLGLAGLASAWLVSSAAATRTATTPEQASTTIGAAPSQARQAN